jgi:hypothetical protein
MQALIQNNTVTTYPYSFAQLKSDNVDISFPASPTVELLELYGVYEVAQVDQPLYDSATQRIEESTPTLVGGVWTQVWNIIDLSAQEIAEQQNVYATQVEAQRVEAYRNESDPLFFKSQRGEATHQQWLDKVDEIKARYPVVGE